MPCSEGAVKDARLNNKISPARIQAYQVLCDVINNKAFSNIAVNNHINFLIRNENDRNLAVNIVYGTLKKLSLLDKILASLSNVSVNAIDNDVRVALLMGLYQLLFLDKIPDYAVVNDAVELCKLYKRASASPYVNAVLRTAIRTKADIPLKHTDFYEAMRYDFGFPEWLTQMLEMMMPKAKLLSVAQAFMNPAPLYVRTNTSKITVDALILRLSDEGISARETYVPGVLRIMSGGSLFSSKAFRDGLFYAQDISGALSGYVLDPKKTDKILDICAAPGGKSFNAAMLSQGADITACDISTSKLDLLRRSAQQLGLSAIKAVRRDATYAVEPRYKDAYDKIICDVPCSGLGVIGRKPEILMNITKTHIDNLLGMQKTMLSLAAQQLKPGGTLIYSTCTINSNENFRQVETLLSERNDVALSEIQPGFDLPAAHDEMAKGYLQLWPDGDACDGFFIAKIVKNQK